VQIGGRSIGSPESSPEAGSSHSEKGQQAGSARARPYILYAGDVVCRSAKTLSDPSGHTHVSAHGSWPPRLARTVKAGVYHGVAIEQVPNYESRRPHETQPGPRWSLYRAIFGIALIVIAWPGSASAMGSCQGTYAAFLLHALPPRPVVALDVRDASPRNQRLADRFLAGMREVGIATGTVPNVTLHVTTSQIIDTARGPGRRAERRSAGLSALQSGNLRSRPAMPRDRITAPSPGRAGPLLDLHVYARRANETRVSWWAAVQCRASGTDREQLAQDLGRLIGGALGRRIERRSM